MNLNMNKIAYVMFLVSLGVAATCHIAQVLGRPAGFDISLAWLMAIFWMLILKLGWPKNPFDK